MDSLFLKQERYYAETSTEIIRECINDIDWDARLISIQGPKGVGKSTLIRQFIRLNYPQHSRKVLYCSMDSLYFSSHSISELVERFVAIGGERLFLDEIHKYAGPWGTELKEIYDLYPRLKVVISGSSLLKILNSEADLSRRCVRYDIQGPAKGCAAAGYPPWTSRPQSPRRPSGGLPHPGRSTSFPCSGQCPPPEGGEWWRPPPPSPRSCAWRLCP